MFSQSIIIPGFDLFSRFIGKFDNPKPNVFVVGYGWGGKNFCEQIDRSKYNVIVIDKKNYFLNTPKLVQFSALNKASININEKNFIEDEVTNIIVKDKLIVSNNRSYLYDYLVVSSGSVPNTFGIKGADTCTFYKTIDDAKKLKESLTSNNKYQIVGAGPTAIEVAFELSKKGKSVTLIEATNTILPNFSDEMRNKVLNKLKDANIELLLEHKVKSIDEHKIETDKKQIPRYYTLWMAGIKPTPLVKEISNVNEYLQHNKNVFVIGDAIRGHGPPTAQNAKQQGIYLAKHFNNNFKSEPYKYNEWCKMIHTPDALLIDYNNKCYSLPVISADFAEYFMT
jgi:NADH dehydrogenase FAD-containing subunit